MNSLPNELLLDIFLYLDLDDLVNLCKTCKDLNNIICYDERTLRYLAKVKYGYNPVFFSELDLPLCEKYKHVIFLYEHYVVKIIQQIKIGALLFYSYVVPTKTFNDFKYVMEFIPMERIKLPLIDIANEAAYQGQFEILRYLFSITSHRYIDWDWKLYAGAAAARNNLDEFVYIISSAPENYNKWNWYQYAERAAKYGNIQMLEFIYANAPINAKLDWDGQIVDAVSYNHSDAVKYIFEHAPDNYDKWRWNSYVRTAIDVNNTEMMKYLFEQAPVNYDEWEWDKYIDNAIGRNNIEMIDYIIYKAPENYPWSWDKYVSKAIDNFTLINGFYQIYEEGNLKTVKHLFSIAPENYDEWNWDNYILLAMQKNELEIVKYLFSIAPEKYDK